jgi:hypothetical protein
MQKLIKYFDDLLGCNEAQSLPPGAELTNPHTLLKKLLKYRYKLFIYHIQHQTSKN